jgi:hypothetical protein
MDAEEAVRNGVAGAQSQLDRLAAEEKVMKASLRRKVHLGGWN